MAPPTLGIDIHAEGAPPADEADALDFKQAALLTEVRSTAHPANRSSTAFERFDRNGPLALLPIGTTRDRYSVVWCDTIACCEQRAALAGTDPDALAVQLQQAFGDALGLLSIDAPIEVVALTRRRRRSLARERAVWIGNAAQTLHPVAGQGLNLGLRDAFELARLLGDEEANQQQRPDPREQYLSSLLRGFVASRARDRATIMTLTDGLARVFRPAALHRVESALLTALDLSPALRRPLAKTLLFGVRN